MSSLEQFPTRSSNPLTRSGEALALSADSLAPSRQTPARTADSPAPSTESLALESLARSTALLPRSADSVTRPSDSLSREFAVSAFDAGIQRPINSFVQFANHLTDADLPELSIVQPGKPSSDAGVFAHHAGAAVGMILPFIAARGAVRTVAGGALAEGRIAAMTLEGGATGFVYGFGLTPVQDKSAFWTSRLKNGVTEAATLATFSGAAGGFARTGFLKVSPGDSLVVRAMKGGAAGALSGAPAGIVHAESRSLVDGRGMASSSEVMHGMRDMAMFGTVFGGARALVFKPAGPLEAKPTTGVETRPASPVDARSSNPADSRPGRILPTPKAERTASDQPVPRPLDSTKTKEAPLETAQPKVLRVNKHQRLGEGDEGTVYSNGDGSVTKVYFHSGRDLSAVAKMFQKLEELGVNVPKIYEWGRAPDGKPAMRMQQVGDGDSLKMQLLTGELSAAERVSLNRQYYATADAISQAGIRIDWNLKNMRFEDGRLYILDPSFLKPEPMSPAIVEMFSGPIGPRLAN